MKKMFVTLAITIDDLSADELKEAREIASLPADEELPGVDEVQTFEITEAIQNMLSSAEVASEWIWAGSNLYAKFEDVSVVTHGWIDTHVQRMEAEHDELTDRLNKLRTFVEENPIFETLSNIDQKLLKQQLEAMTAYEAALGARLTNAALAAAQS